MDLEVFPVSAAIYLSFWRIDAIQSLLQPLSCILSCFAYLPVSLPLCTTWICSIPSDVREGLVEVFYGVYEKDPDKVTWVDGWCGTTSAWDPVVPR